MSKIQHSRQEQTYESKGSRNVSLEEGRPGTYQKKKIQPHWPQETFMPSAEGQLVRSSLLRIACMIPMTHYVPEPTNNSYAHLSSIAIKQQQNNHRT